MRSLRVFLIWLAAGVLADAKVLSVKPTLLSPDEGRQFVGAVRLGSSKNWEWSGVRPDRFRYLSYDLKSTLSLEPDQNDEPTTLDVKGGLEWRFDAISKPVRSFGQRPTTGIPGPSSRPTSGFRWGSLSTELAFAFEGDEPMENRQWAYGLRVNYTPAYDRDDNQWWMPYLWVDYRLIDELGSTVAAKLGVSEQSYWRLGTQVYWQLPLSPWLGRDTFWGNLTLVPGFQYHKSTDRELGLAGGDLADAYYYVLALDYTVPESVRWSGKVPGFRLQVAHGRLPPTTEYRTTVSLAVTVNWATLFK